jgi:hypothetical protein
VSEGEKRSLRAVEKVESKHVGSDTSKTPEGINAMSIFV